MHTYVYIYIGMQEYSVGMNVRMYACMCMYVQLGVNIPIRNNLHTHNGLCDRFVSEVLIEGDLLVQIEQRPTYMT